GGMGEWGRGRMEEKGTRRFGTAPPRIFDSQKTPIHPHSHTQPRDPEARPAVARRYFQRDEQSPSFMDTLIGRLLYRVPLSPLYAVTQFMRHPVQVQTALLRGLLKRAAPTEWGRRFGFGEIARAPDVVAAYQERVPLHTYDDLRADAERVRRGAADVMWP